jgi:hypothetical protein
MTKLKPKKHKKLVFVLCVLSALFGFAPSLFALDGVFFGLGGEANANTRKGTAFAGGLSFGFELNRHIALGLKAEYSHNWDTVAALEGAAFLRWYPALPVRGLFLPAEAGGIVFFEKGENFPALLGGLAAGWRFYLPKNIYVEPYVRGGYPFAWGAGLNLGINIPARRVGV